MTGEAWNAGKLPEGAILTLSANTGPQRIISSKPVGIRWKGGVLQYARQWFEDTRGGIEWVDVPTEPADEAGVEACVPSRICVGGCERSKAGGDACVDVCERTRGVAEAGHQPKAAAPTHGDKA